MENSFMFLGRQRFLKQNDKALNIKEKTDTLKPRSFVVLLKADTR